MTDYAALDALADTLPHTLRGEDAPGFALFEGFADSGTCAAMLADMVQLARAAAAGEEVNGALVAPEQQTDLQGSDPEDFVSKIFRVQRRSTFLQFLQRDDVTHLLKAALGPDVDCFLSQFIFKNPGARGQPWHQDGYYFPFRPARPVAALWLAITDATLENGCLHVLPGSQNQPIHEHVPDRREHANYGYVEIVDHDMSRSQPCLLTAGDLLMFDSHLMHRSTDNVSRGIRAAMVWHFARAGTEDPGHDLGNGRRGPSPVNDWMPLIRDGVTVDQ